MPEPSYNPTIRHWTYLCDHCKHVFIGTEALDRACPVCETGTLCSLDANTARLVLYPFRKFCLNCGMVLKQLVTQPPCKASTTGHTFVSIPEEDTKCPSAAV